MSHSLRTLFVVITLGVFVCLALGGDSPPRREPAEPDAKGKDDVFGHERSRVAIQTAATQVKAGEEFEVNDDGTVAIQTAATQVKALRFLRHQASCSRPGR